MAYGGHKGYIFRRKWITRSLKNIIKDQDFFKKGSEYVADKLGYSGNMVQSFKYWLKASGIVDGGYKLTQFGEIIASYDQYVELDGTQWLIQYKLANNPSMMPVLYYINNILPFSEFTKEELSYAAHKYCSKHTVNGVGEETIKKEIDMIIHLYSKMKSNDPEDYEMRGSVFDDLNLINHENRGYCFRSVLGDSVPAEILYFCFMDWLRNKSTNISIDQILHEVGSPVKAFHISNRGNVFEMIEELKKKDYLHFTRTAGLDMVYFNERDPYKELTDYYKTYVVYED